MMSAPVAKSPRVLVIDVGGTNIKMLATRRAEPCGWRLESSSHLRLL